MKLQGKNPSRLEEWCIVGTEKRLLSLLCSELIVDIMDDSTDLIRIGTCIWNYDSWEGLVYTGGQGSTYLEQYSRHYSTVEVDQWFWTLFKSE